MNVLGFKTVKFHLLPQGRESGWIMQAKAYIGGIYVLVHVRVYPKGNANRIMLKKVEGRRESRRSVWHPTVTLMMGGQSKKALKQRSGGYKCKW